MRKKKKYAEGGAVEQPKSINDMYGELAAIRTQASRDRDQRQMDLIRQERAKWDDLRAKSQAMMQGEAGVVASKIRAARGLPPNAKPAKPAKPAETVPDYSKYEAMDRARRLSAQDTMDKYFGGKTPFETAMGIKALVEADNAAKQYAPMAALPSATQMGMKSYTPEERDNLTAALVERKPDLLDPTTLAGKYFKGVDDSGVPLFSQRNPDTGRSMDKKRKPKEESAFANMWKEAQRLGAATEGAPGALMNMLATQASGAATARNKQVENAIKLYEAQTGVANNRATAMLERGKAMAKYLTDIGAVDPAWLQNTARARLPEHFEKDPAGATGLFMLSQIPGMFPSMFNEPFQFQPEPEKKAMGGAIEPYAEGGAVNPTAQGAQAKLDSGEYVIPIEAVRFYGTKFFQSLIEKAEDSEG